MTAREMLERPGIIWQSKQQQCGTECHCACLLAKASFLAEESASPFLRCWLHSANKSRASRGENNEFRIARRVSCAPGVTLMYTEHVKECGGLSNNIFAATSCSFRAVWNCSRIREGEGRTSTLRRAGRHSRRRTYRYLLVACCAFTGYILCSNSVQRAVVRTRKMQQQKI